MRRLTAVAVTVTTMALGCASAAQAAPGDPDPSFNGGVPVTSNAINAAIAVQSDGKVLVVNGGGLGVTRYDADGRLDTSFGDGGRASVPTTPRTSPGRAVAVGPDGTILVAGEAQSSSDSADALAIARYLPDGTPDPGFAATSGHPGYVTTAATDGDDATLDAIALGPNGTIVGFGYSYRFIPPDTSGASAGYLVRYRADGTADPSFGSGGVTSARVYNHSSGPGTSPPGLAVASSGEIYTAGAVLGYPGPLSVVATRPDGSLDAGFGDGGQATSSQGAGYTGPVLLSGAGEPTLAGGAAVTLARFRGDGSPEQAFGSGGVTVSSIPGGVTGAAQDAQGRIVVAAGARLARFEPDGSIDPTFGVGGVESPNLPTPSPTITGVAIAPSGAIVVAGGDGVNGFVAQYLPSGTPNPYRASVSKNGTGAGTVTDAGAQISCGATCTGAIAPDSSTTFTATAAPGSTFAGWSVASCGRAATCTVTSQPGDPDVSVAARFDLVRPSAVGASPSIGGSRRVGERLLARHGGWSGTGIAYRYQWQRCAPRCRDVARATRTTYRLGARDRGHRIRVLVTAVNAASRRTLGSSPVGPVRAGRAELRSLLGRALAARPSRRGLARSHAYRYRTTTLGAGSLRITWRVGRVTVGTVTVRFRGPRTVRPRLALNRRGRALVAGHRALRLTVVGRYLPQGAPATSRTVQPRLRR